MAYKYLDVAYMYLYIHTVLVYITRKNLFKDSSRDHAFLSHRLCWLGRPSEAKVPKKNLHACLDALLTIHKGHFITAACMELSLESSYSDWPSSATVQVCVADLANKVVTQCTIIPVAILRQSMKKSEDGMYGYARVLCHFAALVPEFTNAWSERDGECVFQCWKIFMHAERRTKYALRLQLQLATPSPDLVHQLTWGRFVNTHGGPGMNIPCDLYNEHVNKLFKEVISNMGANFTEAASTQVAWAATSLTHMAERFDSQTGIHPEATAHTTKSDEADVMSVVKVLQQREILTIHPGWSHHKFPNMSTNPLRSLNSDKLNAWIRDKVKITVYYNSYKETFYEVSEED